MGQASTTNSSAQAQQESGDLAEELKWLSISDNSGVHDSEITSYVQRLLSDIDVSSSITKQRESTQLGKILRTPLPLAHTSDSVCLHPFFLRYEGKSSDDLHTRLTVSSNPEGGQPDQCVVFAQASGSGKTKQAYNLSQKGLPVVLIRVAQPDLNQQHAFTKPWREAFLLLRRLEDVAHAVHPSFHPNIAKTALQVLRILIGAHLEWVALVLERAKQLLPDTDFTPQELRELAMRCLRNGEGETHVKALFLRAIRGCSLQPEPLDSASFFSSLPSTESKKYFDETTSRVLQNLNSGTELVLFFDEVQAIMNHTTSLFVRLADYGRDAVNLAKSDFYYGLCCLISDLMSYVPSTFRFVLSGTHFGITEMTITLGCSPLRDKAAACYVFDPVTQAEILASLDHYLDLGAADPSDSTAVTFASASTTNTRFAAAVSRLCGRPVFFFESGWSCIFKRLSSYSSPMSRSELLDLIADCLENAAQLKLETMKKLVRNEWQSTVVHDGIAVKTLPRDLYYAARMRNGLISFDAVKSTTRYAMAAGILSINPSGNLHKVDLAAEPLLRDAVMHVGDSYVQLTIETGVSGRDDPIFAYLTDRLSGFDPQERLDNKGLLFEEALAWHMVRMSSFTPNRSLGSIFNSLLPTNFEVGDEIDEWHLNASSAIEMKQAGDTDKKSSFLRSVIAPMYSTTVLRGIEERAGLDVVTRLTREDGSRSLLAIQAKAQQSVDFSHALVVTSPQCQYVRNEVRTSMLAGGSLDIKSFSLKWRRIDFETLFKSKFAADKSWVRVVATTNGYGPEVVKAINGYNRKHSDSPILLLCSTARAFGLPLHELLHDLDAAPLRTINDNHLTYFAFDAVLTESTNP
eukprot:GILJ01010396.1.p1 GENE.GILJ01010396.1~~GILJ01010396.1.p1  ORF type:complete len:873 (+),score=91.16 GILJ01010396.1:43-2619(+)